MTPDNLHLSRLTLKRNAEIRPLVNVLQPAAGGERVDVDHRLLWTVMPDEVQARQARGETSFLWRHEETRGRYFVLGPAPRADSSFFEVETKPFEARLSPGDRLQFVLRVNATVDRRGGGRNTRMRVDIAMDCLHKLMPGKRAAHRMDLAGTAAREWLEARAGANGFAVDALYLDRYRAVVIRRGRPGNGQIGVFDLRGLLTVTEPAAFLQRMALGFGRAKAFGCGLMLVRRAG